MTAPAQPTEHRSQADEFLRQVIAAKPDPDPVPPRDPAAWRRFIAQRGW